MQARASQRTKDPRAQPQPGVARARPVRPVARRGRGDARAVAAPVRRPRLYGCRMLADRTLVLVLVGVALALAVAATAISSAVVGWDAVVAFAAAVAAYVRWRSRRRKF